MTERSVIRLDDCDSDQRRLLLALIQNRKSAEKRAAAVPTATAQEDRNVPATPRRRAA